MAQADFLNILLGHHQWATGLLIDRAAELSDEQFHQRFDIGLGSMHDTLRHIVGAAIRWADRIAAQPLRESIEKHPAPFSPRELRGHLDRADADLRRAAALVGSSGRWSETMEFVDDNGSVYRFSRAAAMMHVITHGVHHRAQVVHMRKRLGLPGLGLDLDPVEWECVQTGQIAAR